jgi:hypothetical protein
MKALIIGAIFWIIPFLACGGQEDETESESGVMTFEAFAYYQWAGFGTESIEEMVGTGFLLGVCSFADSESQWGVGLRIGRFSHWTRFDPTKRVEGADAISLDGAGWTVAGDVYYRYPGKYLQPYALFGFGGIYKRHTYHFQSQPDVRKRLLTPAIDMGVGLRVPITSRLLVEPEARFLVSYSKYSWTKAAVAEAGVGIIYVISR